MHLPLGLPIGSILVAAVILALLVALFGRSSGTKPQGRRRVQAGVAGERKVSKVLTGLGIAHVNDYTFYCRGRTVQVDHVLALGDRLLVIETKNFAGEVVASTGPVWEHCQKGGYRRSFQSPVVQNAWHQDALAREFGVSCSGLVVFTGSAILKGHVPDGVIQISQLASVLSRAKATPRGRAARAFKAIQRGKTARSQTKIAVQHIARLSGRRGQGGKTISFVTFAVLISAAIIAAGLIYTRTH